MAPPVDYTWQLAGDADLVVEFSVEQAEVVRYSVLLRHVVWEVTARGAVGSALSRRTSSVRLYDNSHAQGEHHMHRYTLDGQKELPKIFHSGTPTEAMNTALELVKEGFDSMVQPWRR